MQLPGHAVELAGKLLEFVGGVDLDAMSEIAGAEASRAVAQRPHRNQHPPRQQHAGQDRHRKAKRDQQCNAQQQVVDRRQRLAQRLLEDHEPAKLRNRSGVAQHRMAVDVGAGFKRCATRLQQRGDLRQRGNILAPARTLERTCQHEAARIDHIGAADLAHLRLVHKIRQATTVDFGDGAGVASRVSHPDRHEG